MKSERIHLKDEFPYYVWLNAVKYTIQSVKNKHYMQPYNVILYRAILLIN